MYPTLQILLSLALLHVAVTNGNLFTSIARLKPLIATEDKLFGFIEEYISSEEQRLQNIKGMVECMKKERGGLHGNSMVDLGNPVQSFLLLRRLWRQWQEVEHLVLSYTSSEGYLRNIGILRKSTSDYPSEVDYVGAIEALLRLQETYNLPTSWIADGRMLGEETSPALQARDCYEIGLKAWEVNSVKYVYEWMQEAKKRTNANSRTILPAILTNIAEVLDVEGNYEETFKIFTEIQQLDPENTYVNRKKALIKSKVKLSAGDKKKDERNENYMALCRGEQSVLKKPKNPRVLLCRYTHYSRPRLFIRPAKEEILFDEPRLVLYHDILTDTEMDIIIAKAMPQLERSVVGNANANLGASNDRISSIAWLYGMQESSLQSVMPRIEDYTGLSTNIRHREPLQVANYGLGGHFTYHVDDVTTGVTDGYLGMGKRLATVLFYLSNVTAGGATVFPNVGVRIPALKGSAAFWFNYLKNGDIDAGAVHAGCPVLVGDKWASNLWIHEYGQEFRRRCGRTPDDKY